MFFRDWTILLVDDEPDVLGISKLAMKNFDVYGLPLRIYTAVSKADAIRMDSMTMPRSHAHWRSRS